MFFQYQTNLWFPLILKKDDLTDISVVQKVQCEYLEKLQAASFQISRQNQALEAVRIYFAKNDIPAEVLLDILP